MKTNGVGNNNTGDCYPINDEVYQDNFEQKWEDRLDELKAIVNDLSIQGSLKPVDLSELHPRFLVVADTLKGYQMQNVPLNSYLGFKLQLAMAVLYNNLCYHMKANEAGNNAEDYNPVNLNQENFEEGRELVTGYLKAVRSLSIEDLQQPIGWGGVQVSVSDVLTLIRKEEAMYADLELQLTREALGAESSCREAD